MLLHVLLLLCAIEYYALAYSLNLSSTFSPVPSRVCIQAAHERIYVHTTNHARCETARAHAHITHSMLHILI